MSNKLTNVTDNNVEKISDNEVIKGLEWCQTAANHIGSATLSKEQISAIFNLIDSLKVKVIKERNKNSKLRNKRNRLQAENDELFDALDYRAKKILELEDNLKTAKAENERLSKEVDRLSQEVMYNDSITEMKVEEAETKARKEVVDKLKNEIINDTAYACDITQHSGYYDYQIKIGDIPEYIDNILKEFERKENTAYDD